MVARPRRRRLAATQLDPDASGSQPELRLWLPGPHGGYQRQQAKGSVAGDVKQAGFNWIAPGRVVGGRDRARAIRLVPARQHRRRRRRGLTDHAQLRPRAGRFCAARQRPDARRSGDLRPVPAGGRLALRGQGPGLRAVERGEPRSRSRRRQRRSVDLPAAARGGLRGVKAGDPAALVLLGAPEPDRADGPGVSSTTSAICRSCTRSTAARR